MSEYDEEATKDDYDSYYKKLESVAIPFFKRHINMNFNMTSMKIPEMDDFEDQVDITTTSSEDKPKKKTKKTKN